MPPEQRDATEQKILQKENGTFVWLTEWSAEEEAQFLPTGALDFPTENATDLDPPPKRVRIFFDAVANAFKFKDEFGAEFSFGGGATSFLGLTDTPAAYTGQGGKIAAVNAGETGLEFIDPAGGRFPCFLRTVTADFTIDTDQTCIGKNLVLDPGVSIILNGTGELHLL